MRIALALLVMLAACEPDYSDTAFLCDATHGCPDEQACVGGRCRRGGVAGMVACGVGGTCTAEQQCCVDSTNPPRCIPAGDECPNGYAALCDGPADCQSGDTCCYASDLIRCQDTCERDYVCTVDPDCPSGEPHCCPDGTEVPWGYCQFDACSP